MNSTVAKQINEERVVKYDQIMIYYKSFAISGLSPRRVLVSVIYKHGEGEHTTDQSHVC